MKQPGGLYMGGDVPTGGGQLAQASFLEELMAAGRGVIAIITGNRQAGAYFDYSPAGVAGSFIAFLAITGINATVPVLLGARETGGIARTLLMLAVLYLLQLGCSAIALRQMKKSALLPAYIVTDNWATFFLGLLSSALAAAGLGGDAVLIFLALVVIVVEVNIARVIMGLTPLQIAMFLIAQLVGVSIGLAVLGLMLPLPPETAAILQPA